MPYSIPIQIDGHLAKFRDGQLAGRDTSIDLTAAEEQHLLHHVDQTKTRARAIDGDRDPGTVNALRLGRHRAALRARLVMMVDTTLALNALTALRAHKAPSAVELMDLNAFTVGAVCADELVALGAVRQYTEALEPVSGGIDRALEAEWFRHLELDQDDIRELDTVYETAVTATSREQDLWTAEWREAIPLRPGLALNLDRLPSSATVDVVMEPTRVDSLYSAANQGPTPDDLAAMQLERTRAEDFAEYLGLQTVRTIFNDRVAGTLCVPYIASAVRAPVYLRLAARKNELWRLIHELLDVIGTAERTASRRSGSPAKRVQAPFLLGLLLSRMKAQNKTPDDYWAEVADLRAACEPLRAWLRTARDNSASMLDADPADEIAKSLRVGAAAYTSAWQEAAATVVLGANIATPDGTTPVATGVKLAATAYPAHRAREQLRQVGRFGHYPVLVLPTGDQQWLVDLSEAVWEHEASEFTPKQLEQYSRIFDLGALQ